MRIGIDASNLRTGGGITHLRHVLGESRPAIDGFEGIVVWGGAATLRDLPAAPWIEYRHESMLERSTVWRQLWQQVQLPRLIARESCDVLFSPGSTLPASVPCPAVVMSQNMLPFAFGEARRYGLSPMFLRLAGLHLAHS